MRRACRRLAAYEIADDHGRDVAQRTRELELGEGAIDPIRRLADFFEQEDHRLTRAERRVGQRPNETREQLEIAAEGGLMDVIMIAMNPWLEKDSRLNRAIDACYKKNIGLVAMKVVAGVTAPS